MIAAIMTPTHKTGHANAKIDNTIAHPIAAPTFFFRGGTAFALAAVM